MSLKAKLAYKPVGMIAGVGAGLLAGLVFKQVWRGLAGEDPAPQAIDQDRGWAEVLLAATLQGAIFGLVRAAVDRGGAVAVRRATGDWPT
jgi:predicted metal-dependent enzyme (double-stranded beta helix superfamily)